MCIFVRVCVRARARVSVHYLVLENKPLRALGLFFQYSNLENMKENKVKILGFILSCKTAKVHV